MTIRQINNRAKKYQEGKLSEKEKSELARAIMDNQEAKNIAFGYLISEGRFVSAFSILGWEYRTKY